MRGSRVTALAIGILLASAHPAAAFVRATATSTGACLFWENRKIPWYLTVDAAGEATPDVLVADALAALQKSFHTWETAQTGCQAPGTTCTDLTFDYKGTTTDFDGRFVPCATDNRNLVIFRRAQCSAVVDRPDGGSGADGGDTRDPCFAAGSCGDIYNCWDHSFGTIALTTTQFEAKSGVIVGAVIEVNDTGGVGSQGFVVTTADGPSCPGAPDGHCVARDIQDTVTHEAGHLIGLDHTPNQPGNVMYNDAAYGETSKRCLAEDDVAGLCTIYPKAAATPLCPANGVTGATPLCPAAVPEGCHCGSGGAVTLAWLPLLAFALLRRRVARG